MILTDDEINERIAIKKGWKRLAIDVEGYFRPDGINKYQYERRVPDSTTDWRLAGELLEELLDNEQLVTIEHNTWHSGYAISQTDKDKFCPTLMRAIAEYWLEWRKG